MSTPPKTVRDALITEMLGDLDDMLSRIEKLPLLVADCEQRLAISAANLEESGKKYGKAVCVFTEEAKGELADFLEKETTIIANHQDEAMRKIVRKALLSESENFRSMFSGTQQLRFYYLFKYSMIALFSSCLVILLTWFFF